MPEANKYGEESRKEPRCKIPGRITEKSPDAILEENPSETQEELWKELVKELLEESWKESIEGLARNFSENPKIKKKMLFHSETKLFTLNVTCPVAMIFYGNKAFYENI